MVIQQLNRANDVYTGTQLTLLIVLLIMRCYEINESLIVRQAMKEHKLKVEVR